MLGLGCWALGIEPLLAIVAGAPVMYGIARGGLAVVELRQVSDKLCSVGGGVGANMQQGQGCGCGGFFECECCVCAA